MAAVTRGHVATRRGAARASALHGFAHHLGVATVLVSLFVVLDRWGAMGWLDSLALRVALAAQVQQPPRAAAVPADAAALATVPIVATITRSLYEEAFNETSPLQRNGLADIVARLDALQPTGLVIDLDLAPTASDGPSELDALLLRITAQGRARVVLATPGPAVTEAARLRRYAWMQRLCQGGIEFAYPDVLSSQGVVLRFDRGYPSLGVAAARTAPAPTAAIAAPCALVAAGPDRAVFLDAAYAALTAPTRLETARLAPINGAFWAYAHPYQLSIRDLAAPLDRPDVKGRMVFLGGQYDEADLFRTPFGEESGVFLHAAIFYSQLHPVGLVSHAKAVLIDLCIGVGIGWLFSATWSGFRACSHRLTSGLNWTDYLRSRLWLVANLGSFVLLIVAIFMASAWLLRRELWNAPAAMVAGTFLHAIVTSSHGGAEVEAAASPHSAGRSRRPWQVRAGLVDLALLSPLVVIAIVILFREP